MSKNWQLIRLMDLYRTAGRTARLTPSMTAEILNLEHALEGRS